MMQELGRCSRDVCFSLCMKEPLINQASNDDITADAVAAAFNKPIGIRDDAKKILEDFYGANHIRSSSARMRMARVPEGATLIRNDISRAPGFRLRTCMSWPTCPQYSGRWSAHCWIGCRRAGLSRPGLSRCSGPKAESLEKIVRRFGSYPFRTEQKYGANLVVRGTGAPEVETAAELLVRQFPGDAEFIHDES